MSIALNLRKAHRKGIRQAQRDLPEASRQACMEPASTRKSVKRRVSDPPSGPDSEGRSKKAIISARRPEAKHISGFRMARLRSGSLHGAATRCAVGTILSSSSESSRYRYTVTHPASASARNRNRLNGAMLVTPIRTRTYVLSCGTSILHS